MLGRIAALHAISDLFASHAQPHHALALLTLPSAMGYLQQDDITHILAGAIVALHENGAYLSGGHTAQGQGSVYQDMQVGFAVTGIRDRTPLYTPQDGDAIILTKPLGIGMIMAGHKQGHPLANGQLRDAAIAVMAESNGQAADVLKSFGRFPMTDVTGFGLIRHLMSLMTGLDDNRHSAELISTSLPFIQTDSSSVLELALNGVESSIMRKNKAAAPFVPDGDIKIPPSLLFDPQTGGGLLAIVPQAQCPFIMAKLLDHGMNAAHIGHIRHDGFAQIKVRAEW